MSNHGFLLLHPRIKQTKTPCHRWTTKALPVGANSFTAWYGPQQYRLILSRQADTIGKEGRGVRYNVKVSTQIQELDTFSEKELKRDPCFSYRCPSF